jgi:GNAT superfamily N-acetyltransferase
VATTRRLTFLIDTNVFLTLEDGAVSENEPFDDAALFARRVHEHGHRLAVHSEARTDIGRDTDVERQTRTLKALDKYVVLDNVPESPRLVAAFGGGSENDRVDALIASALEANAADYLVTEDKQLRRRVLAADPGLRVLSLAEGIEFLAQLHPAAPEPPPLVNRVECYRVELSDPIFESIREDYDGFDNWFADKCQRNQREAFVIDGRGALAGICILKDENDEEYGLPSKRLKLCTVKVADAHRRQRLGELLLKAALDDGVKRGLSGLYVTVFPKHYELIGLLQDLGWTQWPEVTDRNELVMWRPLVPPASAIHDLDPFEFNRCYGPHNLNTNVPMHIVPIQPHWEERLFPEGRTQLGLFGENAACGNGLRKAYLSRSSSRQVKRGDIVLFYRSGDERAVRFVAVVEDVIRSRDPVRLATFVGTRTVYSADEIEELSGGGRREVAAMLLRQSRFLEPGLTYADLFANNVVAGPPQSTQGVPEKGAKWVRSVLNG